MDKRQKQISDCHFNILSNMVKLSLGSRHKKKSSGWAGGGSNAETVDGRQSAAKQLGEKNDNQ